MEKAGDLHLSRIITDHHGGHLDCSSTKVCLLSDGRLDLKLSNPSKRSRFLARFSSSEKPDGEGTSLVAPVEGTDLPPTPPTMDIVIQAVGSRGDIQPFVALGLALKQAGHRVRIATHPAFESFVKDHGLQFFSIGGDPKRLMAYMVKNPGLLPSLHSIREGDIQENRADIREILDGCWRSCFEQVEPIEVEYLFGAAVTRPFRANAIIANPPSFAHVHCAEKMGIPLHLMFTMPWSPTQVFPHPLANVHPSSFEPKVSNYLSYALVEILTWEGLGGVINDFRRHTLGLKPLDRSSGPNLISQLSIPYTYCWSPALIPKPEDWAAHISISGFYFLAGDSAYTPPPELESFLSNEKAGPVVYIGFGSIVVEDPKALTRLLLEAIEMVGPVRALISQGWSDLGGDDIEIPPNVYLLGNCPHDWVFRQVSCVVHHGGAGTTAAAVAAGKPSVIVPFFGDQPFWGRMVEKAGAGPPPIPFKKLTARNLAGAIETALKPETLEGAQLLGQQVNQEDGVDMGVSSFYQQLRKARMRCCIGPSCAATWAVRRTDVRLGNIAAAALIEMGLLDVEKLELMRPCRYNLNIGPRDPFSGMALAMVDVASDSIAGLDRFCSSVVTIFGPKSDNNGEASEDVTPGKLEVARSGLGGLGHASVAVVRMPVQVGVALTQGLHSMPKIWSDRRVRPQRNVEGVPTGIKAGFQELFLGTYDGMTSLVMCPIQGGRQHGFTGGLTGVCTGVLSGAAQSLSGLTAIFTYPLKGVDVGLSNRFAKTKPSAYEKALLEQGLTAFHQLPGDSTPFLVTRWHEAIGNVKQSKLKRKTWRRAKVQSDK